MIENLIEWDKYLFQLINQQWANGLFDLVMPWFRNKYFWAPLYAFFLTFLVVNFRQRGVMVIIFAIVTIILSDQISATLLKPLLNRVRPCNDADMVQSIRLLVNCGSGQSLPSAHAANHFAFAIFMSMMLARLMSGIWPLLLLWAVGVSYAQVYVGVHYPLDVILGALLGVVLGMWMAMFCSQIMGWKPGAERWSS